MSVTGRILSGSMAAWTNMLISIGSQVALLPFFLTYWEPRTYGAWVILQAVLGMLPLIDKAHQDFVGMELLVVGNECVSKLQSVLAEAISVEACIAIIQILVTICIFYSSAFNWLIGQADLSSQSLIADAARIACAYTIMWAIFGCVGGVLVRAVAPLGHYCRMAWWAVLNSMFTSIMPVFAIALGGSIFEAGLTLVITCGAISFAMQVDILRILKKNNVEIRFVGFRSGLRRLLTSQSLSIVLCFDSIRQQGIRLLISPFSRTDELAAFAAMRTGANAALQGLSGLTNPLMPELMRFVHQKDNDRIHICFASIWFLVITILSGSIVGVQVLAKPLFDAWTRGKLEFHPGLFCVMSLSVLVYSCVIPAAAIIRGNNLLRTQLVGSVLTATVVLSLLFILIKPLGILGAGIALLVAEILNGVYLVFSAQRWLAENGLSWPREYARKVMVATVVVTSSLIGIVGLPKLGPLVLLISLLLLTFNAWKFYVALPELARKRTFEIVARFTKKIGYRSDQRH